MYGNGFKPVKSPLSGRSPGPGDCTGDLGL